MDCKPKNQSFIVFHLPMRRMLLWYIRECSNQTLTFGNKFGARDKVIRQIMRYAM